MKFNYYIMNNFFRNLFLEKPTGEARTTAAARTSGMKFVSKKYYQRMVIYDKAICRKLKDSRNDFMQHIFLF